MRRDTNARAHYRVVYPTTGRPRFREFGVEADHAILDCSEEGLRYETAQPPAPPVGAQVEGTVFFPDGEECRVAGVVVRTFQGEVALRLNEVAIPFTRIIKQQRYLRQKYALTELSG